MTLEEMITTVRELIQYPEIDGETSLEEWISIGDWQNMTAAEIAEEWDDLSVTLAV